MLAGFLFSERSYADTKTVPELSLYWTHNHLLRSRFASNATYSEKAGEFTHATFEYNMDIGLLSYFRRYVFKDPNAEKSKRITFRLGYAYFPDLTTGDPDADEKRWLGEATFRLPIGNRWLLTDRNRGELRRIAGVDSGRYRNRLRMESNLAMGKFKMTPYTHVEGIYDGRVDDWNQADVAVGAEFPWWTMILEVSVTAQFKKSATNDELIGITLQKHL